MWKVVYVVTLAGLAVMFGWISSLFTDFLIWQVVALSFFVFGSILGVYGLLVTPAKSVWDSFARYALYLWFVVGCAWGITFGGGSGSGGLGMLVFFPNIVIGGAAVGLYFVYHQRIKLAIQQMGKSFMAS